MIIRLAGYERLGGQWVGQQQIYLGEGDVTAAEVAYGWSNIADLIRAAAENPGNSQDGLR